MFTRARAAGIYDDTLREAIHALKFKGARELVRPLSRVMVQTWETHPAQVDLIVPVPLHRSRVRERGFNQSELLAREVARTLGLPMHPHLLRRCRATAAQSGLGAPDRRANVSGAFGAVEPAPGTVLLIDDVFSTGFTASECARVLRRAGSIAVYVLTAAMALGPE